MRILIINPNTSEEVSRFIERAALGPAQPGTEIVVKTAPFGSSAIQSIAEGAIAAHAVLTTLAQNWRGHDAIILGALSDPGLAAASEISPVPVFGMGKCGLLAAAEGGRSFSLVTLGLNMKATILDQIKSHGLFDKLVSIEFLSGTVAEFTTNRGRFLDEALALINKAHVDGAEAVLLGGGPLSGLSGELTRRATIPLVDGIEAAIRAAETMECKPAFSIGSKTVHRGIDPELSDLLRRLSEPCTDL